jgi:L-cysteine S-thiosulfotransferase
MRSIASVFALLLPLACAVVHAQGKAVPEALSARDKGNCLACHQLPDGVGPPNRSDVGPRLEGGRMRTLGKSRLRELVSDPTASNPDTVMPPFGKHRLLDAAEIDRIVEYLHALP